MGGGKFASEEVRLTERLRIGLVGGESLDDNISMQSLLEAARRGAGARAVGLARPKPGVENAGSDVGGAFRTVNTAFNIVVTV